MTQNYMEFTAEVGESFKSKRRWWRRYFFVFADGEWEVLRGDVEKSVNSKRERYVVARFRVPVGAVVKEFYESAAEGRVVRYYVVEGDGFREVGFREEMRREAFEAGVELQRKYVVLEDGRELPESFYAVRVGDKTLTFTNREEAERTFREIVEAEKTGKVFRLVYPISAREMVERGTLPDIFTLRVLTPTAWKGPAAEVIRVLRARRLDDGLVLPAWGLALPEAIERLEELLLRRLPEEDADVMRMAQRLAVEVYGGAIAALEELGVPVSKLRGLGVAREDGWMVINFTLEFLGPEVFRELVSRGDIRYDRLRRVFTVRVPLA